MLAIPHQLTVLMALTALLSMVVTPLMATQPTPLPLIPLSIAQPLMVTPPMVDPPLMAPPHMELPPMVATMVMPLMPPLHKNVLSLNLLSITLLQFPTILLPLPTTLLLLPTTVPMIPITLLMLPTTLPPPSIPQKFVRHTSSIPTKSPRDTTMKRSTTPLTLTISRHVMKSIIASMTTSPRTMSCPKLMSPFKVATLIISLTVLMELPTDNMVLMLLMVATLTGTPLRLHQLTHLFTVPTDLHTKLMVLPLPTIVLPLPITLLQFPTILLMLPTMVLPPPTTVLLHPIMALTMLQLHRVQKKFVRHTSSTLIKSPRDITTKKSPTLLTLTISRHAMKSIIASTTTSPLTMSCPKLMTPLIVATLIISLTDLMELPTDNMVRMLITLLPLPTDLPTRPLHLLTHPLASTMPTVPMVTRVANTAPTVPRPTVMDLTILTVPMMITMTITTTTTIKMIITMTTTPADLHTDLTHVPMDLVPPRSLLLDTLLPLALPTHPKLIGQHLGINHLKMLNTPVLADQLSPSQSQIGHSTSLTTSLNPSISPDGEHVII